LLWETFRLHKHLNVGTHLSDYGEFVEVFLFFVLSFSITVPEAELIIWPVDWGAQLWL